MESDGVVRMQKACWCWKGSLIAFLSETLLQLQFSKSVFPEILWYFHLSGKPLQCWELSWKGAVTADFISRSANALEAATTTPVLSPLTSVSARRAGAVPYSTDPTAWSCPLISVFVWSLLPSMPIQEPLLAQLLFCTSSSWGASSCWGLTQARQEVEVCILPCDQCSKWDYTYILRWSPWRVQGWQVFHFYH